MEIIFNDKPPNKITDHPSGKNGSYFFYFLFVFYFLFFIFFLFIFFIILFLGYSGAIEIRWKGLYIF
jgi:hypothetical protein